MAALFTAAQLRGLKAARDAEGAAEAKYAADNAEQLAKLAADGAIVEICDEIRIAVVTAATEGKTQLAAFLFPFAQNKAVALGFTASIPHTTYNAILNNYLVDGCVDGLRTTFPDCVVGVEGDSSRKITVSW